MSVSVEQIESDRVLSDVERAELAELEAVIERGVKSFVDIGRALQRVQESRLYREQFATFEVYVAARFELKRLRAYELIEAAKVHDLLLEKSNTLPARESHAAALAPLRDNPEEMAKVWDSATSTAAAAARPVTAQDVKDARKRIAPPASAAAPVLAPYVPDGDASSDLRFAQIEEAAQLLKTLPAADRVVWPVDEGDVEAVGEAVEWLAKYVPALARSWREHQRSRRRLRVV